MLTKIIKSYVYTEYDDDEDIQAFAQAYNEMAQDYLDTFIALNLPVYTSASISGALLDWVGEGIYGMSRPALPLGHTSVIGPFNTYPFNTLPFNGRRSEATNAGGATFYVASDDIYKRILTWAFYKGDGRFFTIRWLKRRIMRFLFGDAGVSFNVDQTYPVSITFGIGNQVNIQLLTYVRRITGGAIFGRMGFNRVAFNALTTSVEQLDPIPNADIFVSAVRSGVLELPFQFDWVVIDT